MTSMLLLSTMVVVAVAASDCSYSRNGATFDLSKLTKPAGQVYRTKDTFWRDERRPFYYDFNICAKAPSPDPSCDVFEDGAVAAYQVSNSTVKKCFALGSVDSMGWELLDHEDSNAALGVRLFYEDGQECSTPGLKRSFKINVYCAKEESTLAPLSTASEDLQATCTYEVDVHSVWGCPTECHSSTHDKLCTGHGTCSIDRTLNKARCFCNEGWGGEECNKEMKEFAGPSSSSVNTALFVIVVLLLLVLLYVSYVLFGKIKALNYDSNPYGAMPVTASDADDADMRTTM